MNIQKGRKTNKCFRALLGVASVLGLAMSVASPATASNASDAKTKLLSVRNLPAGWGLKHAAQGGDSLLTSPCFSGIRKAAAEGASTNFADKGSLPEIGEVLVLTSKARREWSSLNRALAACNHTTLINKGKTFHATVGAMSFPSVGTESRAYAVAINNGGIALVDDAVLFRAGSFVGLVDYGTDGTPIISAAEAFVRQAVVKVTSSSSTAKAPPATTTPTSAPPTTTSTASEIATAGQHFLTIETSIVSAGQKFLPDLKSDGATVTVAERLRQVAPLVTALRTGESRLADYAWPQVAQADVKALISDFGAMVAGVDSLATNAAHLATQEAALAHDLTAAETASAAVRHDLGLPPLPPFSPTT